MMLAGATGSKELTEHYQSLYEAAYAAAKKQWAEQDPAHEDYQQ
jgi:hypothetical protein